MITEARSCPPVLIVRDVWQLRHVLDHRLGRLGLAHRGQLVARAGHDAARCGVVWCGSVGCGARVGVNGWGVVNAWCACPLTPPNMHTRALPPPQRERACSRHTRTWRLGLALCGALLGLVRAGLRLGLRLALRLGHALGCDGSVCLLHGCTHTEQGCVKGQAQQGRRSSQSYVRSNSAGARGGLTPPQQPEPAPSHGSTHTHTPAAMRASALALPWGTRGAAGLPPAPPLPLGPAAAAGAPATLPELGSSSETRYLWRGSVVWCGRFRECQ